jgi:rsbT co-antagonist protein RsbR
MHDPQTSVKAEGLAATIEERAGQVFLGGSRALLYSHVAVEMLRKQLFHQVGEELARAILAQAAHHGGWNDAQLLMQEQPFDNLESMLHAQYEHLSRSGFGTFELHEVALNKAQREVYMRVTCKGSPEAESHRRLFGLGTQPACYHLVGYSSGWASAVLGMQILTVETRCAAKGDPRCEFETLPYEDFFVPEALFWKRAFESTSVSLAQELKEKLTTIESQLSIIERQRLALAVLSAPILQLTDGVLTLPIIGAVDGDRAMLMTERLLDAIVRYRAFGVIIDVTGVESLEARTAQNLSRMAQAARLLGAKVVLTGIAPSVAQVLVAQDIRLADVRTCRTLKDGIHVLRDSKSA